MKRIFCDVCGDEITGPAYDCLASRADIQRACPHIKDVCPACLAAAKSLDVQAVVLDAWRGSLKKRGAKARKGAGVRTGTKGGRRKKDADAGQHPEPAQGASDHETGADGPGSHALAGSGQLRSGAFAPADQEKAQLAEAGPADPVHSGATVKPAVPVSSKPRVASGAEPAKRRGRPRRKFDLEPPEPDEPAEFAYVPQARPGRGMTGNASDKSRIMRALVMYRAEKGVGSLHALADAAGVTADQLRRAIAAERFEFDWWQQVEAGLIKLGRDVHPAEPEV